MRCRPVIYKAVGHKQSHCQWSVSLDPYLGTILHKPRGNLSSSEGGGRKTFTSASHPEGHRRARKRKRARNEESKTHHFTNTTTTAGDQHDLTVDTEEILNVEGGHGYGFETSLRGARASVGLASRVLTEG